MTTNVQFWVDQITATQNKIVAYNNAIDALTIGGVQSYTLDTGQSRTTVSKFDLKDLNDAVDGLLNRLATLEARVYGCGVVIARPVGC